MTTNSMDQGESPIDTGQRLDIKPISEAFAQGREDIVINHSQEVNIGPEAAEFARLFHHVGIQSFADLQALSFIPESLDQTRALEALASDDASAFSAAQNYVHAGNKPCGCREAQTTGEIYRKGGYALELRAAYQDIRGRHNPQLARLLTEVYRKEVTWDSLIATHVYRWVHRVQVVGMIPMWLFLPNDITVLNNATLNLSATTKLLWANEIRIHVGGKICAHSPYTKIKCTSIQGKIP